MKLIVLFFCCLLLAPCISPAEELPPRHACTKPVHPNASALNDPTVAKAALPKDHDFDTQLDRYKDCIWKFVVAERAAAKLHATAADNAIEDWYAFIRESLASGAVKEP